ncbi:MAG: pyrroline-5-carboxylate reductase [Pseudomonadota bacterium]
MPNQLPILNNQDSSLLLVGAGKMGGAMLKGWLEQGLDPNQINIQDPSPSQDIIDFLAKYDCTVNKNPQENKPIDVIVLAIKPQQIDDSLFALRDIAKNSLILSVIAGCKTERLQEIFDTTTPIVRAMPNTPASIGCGITALFANRHVNPKHKEDVQNLMSAVGKTLWLEKEADMDAVTAISGSGPAYVFLLAEALAKAGETAGLQPELAQELAKATLCGSGALMEHSGMSPETLRKNVTSPGGTTQAALNVLMQEKTGLQNLLTQAVMAAKQRSQELS